jgi:hypothetical protein
MVDAGPPKTRPIASDDYDLRFFLLRERADRPGAPVNVIQYIQIGHYAGYSLVGRTEVNPLPVDPDFKISGRLWAFALYPELAPAVDRGNGILRYRYADPARADGAWSWNPWTRRLRRLNEGFRRHRGRRSGFRSGSLFGLQSQDRRVRLSLSGREQPACRGPRKFHGDSMPPTAAAAHAPKPGNRAISTQSEATPRPSRLTQALQAKSVIYVNSETWFAPYVDTYSRDSQLFQNVVFWLAYRDRAVPEARVAIYPFLRQFVVGAARTGLQTGFATMCYLPGIENPERECWYVNMGAVTRVFFTTRAMSNAAP